MHPMNGLLLVDKPSGMTSHDVVHKVRRVLGIRGIGHAGTLDPLASGLLVLLIGEATKVSDYLLNGDKGYEVKVRLGVKTDSMDITGQVLQETSAENLPADAKIRAVAMELQGALELEVPVHSAVKVDGRKLYEFAHKGQRPDEVPKRTMKFYGIEVIDYLPTHELVVRLRCSKGSFIRAWANELGECLGCGATVSGLRRLYSEPLEIDGALGLEEIETRWNNREERHGQVLAPAWIPLKDSLPHFRRFDVSGQDEVLLRNGQISKSLQAQLLPLVQPGQDLPPVRVVSRESDDLVAILLAEPGQFYKIKRVFLKA